MCRGENVAEEEKRRRGEERGELREKERRSRKVVELGEGSFFLAPSSPDSVILTLLLSYIVLTTYLVNFYLY